MFDAWRGVIEAGLGDVKHDHDEGVTLVTVTDDEWRKHIPYGEREY